MGRLAHDGPLRAIEDYVSENCRGWAFKAKNRLLQKDLVNGQRFGKAGFMLRTPNGLAREWAFSIYYWSPSEDPAARLEHLLRSHGWPVGGSYGETMVGLYAFGPAWAVGMMERYMAEQRYNRNV